MISIFNVFFYLDAIHLWDSVWHEASLRLQWPKVISPCISWLPTWPTAWLSCVVTLHLFVPSIFWVTNLRKRRVVHNSGHIVSPWQGLTFHSSGPGIGWGGARVPLIHRSQPGWGLLAGPLSLLIWGNFFFLTFILLLSIALMLEPHVHLLPWASRLSSPLCPLFPTNARERMHTHTHTDMAVPYLCRCRA